MADFNRIFELRQAQVAALNLTKELRTFLHVVEAAIGPAEGPAHHVPPVACLFDETPISKLGLSIRPSNVFAVEGIRTVGDLVARSDRELLNLTNFSHRSLAEVREAMALYRQKAAAE